MPKFKTQNFSNCPVDVGWLSAKSRGVKQVAAGGGKLGINVAAALKPERGPVDVRNDAGGKFGLEKGAGGGDVREGGFDDFIVRLMQTGHA